MSTIATILAFLFIFEVNGQATEFQRFLFNNETQPKFVGNDGSPAGYYYHFGNPNKFILHLMGGSWCINEVTCANRYQQNKFLMSSDPWPVNITFDGIFSSNATINPDWYDATMIYVPYCSSDSFSGTLGKSTSTAGWNFYGKYVLTGVVNDLISVGLGTAQNVLVSGCSAGGMAVIANLDYIETLLPENPNRNYRGHSDAGFFQEINAMARTDYTFQEVAEIGMNFWGGVPDESCVDARPNDTWRCFLGEFADQHITTPILYHQETEDSAQLGLMGVSYPFTGNMTEYIQYWRQNITNSLKAVTSPHAVFAPACYTHCIIESSMFYTITLSGTKLADVDALHEFFFSGESGDWIDDCEGFNCSGDCPSP